MSDYDDLSLEQLFAEADRIGNKYLSSQEQEAFQRQLSQVTHNLRNGIEEQGLEQPKQSIAPDSKLNYPYRKYRKKSDEMQI